MAQHDYDIANGTGFDVRTDLNNVFSAIATSNSGASAPATTFPHQIWVDTTANVVKRRNAANTAWTIVHWWDQPTRAAVTTAHIPAGVDQFRTGGYTTEGDGGGARYKRAGAEPSHALKVQSGDGAWWELVPDPTGINVRQAGAKGDNVTDDSQAFIDAINGVDDLNVSGTSKATHRVIVPGSVNQYYMGATNLEIKRFVHIMGVGSGLDNTPRPVRLRWDANITGIIVHANNTLGATTEGTGTGSGGGSIIEGLQIHSDGGTIAGITDDTKGHGVWMRARAHLVNCVITDFPGNGVHIKAASGSGGATEGNANGWQLDRLRISECHLNGVACELADTNAGVATAVDVSSCGRWGLSDISFLGNTWIGCQSESCGLATIGENGAAETSFVDFAGEQYIANYGATEAQLVATQPGTDKTIWIHVGTGSANITWTASQPEGTFFVGGSYHAQANASIFQGCYHEAGQAFPQVAGLMWGGNHDGNYFAGAGLSIRDNQIIGQFNAWNNTKTFPESTVSRDLNMSFWPDTDRPMRVVANGDSVLGLTLAHWDNAGGRWAFTHGNTVVMYVTSDLTTATYGRASAFAAAHPVFERGIVVGAGGSARHMTNGTAAPTAGEHARGEIVWNSAPSAGGTAGWICTASGTPGTWKTFATISA